MRWSGDLPIESSIPSPGDVLRALGVPPDRAPDERMQELLQSGVDELRKSAQPRGVYAHVEGDEFARVYEGEGDNAPDSPLAHVYPQAELLALFAVTAGADVSARISELFTEGEYALGGVLDAAASEAAELAAEQITRSVDARARAAGLLKQDVRALRYSPGYCGWDLTGQRALFATLRPEDAGIALRESCLMEPVKSISGVIVFATARAHEFTDNYEFCSDCRTHECRERIAQLRETL